MLKLFGVAPTPLRRHSYPSFDYVENVTSVFNIVYLHLPHPHLNSFRMDCNGVCFWDAYGGMFVEGGG